MAGQNFVFDRCYAQWAYTKGWRMWRDRFLYGHVAHRCAGSHAPYGTCICECGSRLRLVIRPGSGGQS